MSSTIKQAIEALKGRIADAYTAVSAKGGTLPATQDSDNLPTAIASIPSGGGGSVVIGTLNDNNCWSGLEDEDFGLEMVSYIKSFSFDSIAKNCPNLKKFDLHNAIIAKVSSWYSLFPFQNCPKLEVVDLRFVSCPIPTSAYRPNFFYLNPLLREFRVGNWAVWSINIDYASSMGREEIVQFLEDLPTPADNNQVITMGSAKLSLLTAEDRAIATNKGWTLA